MNLSGNSLITDQLALYVAHKKFTHSKCYFWMPVLLPGVGINMYKNLLVNLVLTKDTKDHVTHIIYNF